MKTNRILLSFIAFFSTLVILSFALFFTFLHQNNLTWSEYWKNSDIYGSITLPKLKFNKGIKTIHEEVNFPLVSKLSITVDIESVSFVEEERDDILVVYDYRHPNASEYDIRFQSFHAEEEIHLIAGTKAKQGNHRIPLLNNDLSDIYRGSIVVYVPKAYQFQTLSITTSFSNIDRESVYQNADNFVFASSMGNIQFEVNTPKQVVSINTDLGNISIYGNADIHTLDVISNLGNCYLQCDKSLHTLYLLNDFGNSTIVMKDSLFGANIQTNVGNTVIYNQNLPRFLSATSLSGDISAYFPENDSCYIHSVNGRTDSYFSIQDSDRPHFSFESHNGDISILKNDSQALEALQQVRE